MRRGEEELEGGCWERTKKRMRFEERGMDLGVSKRKRRNRKN